MEKIQNQSDNSKNIFKKRFSFWSPGFIIAGFILYSGQIFIKTAADELVVFIIAITAGILYSKIKRKINFVNNGLLNGIIVGIGLLFISAFLIGFLTAIF